MIIKFLVRLMRREERYHYMDFNRINKQKKKLK